MSAIAPGRAGSAGRFEPRAGAASGRGTRAVGLTLVAFALLCGYGVMRWATMLAAPSAARFTGLVACACAVAALGEATRARDRRARIAANGAIVVAAVAMIPIAGIPLAWVVHLRLALIDRTIAHGISQLPGVFVPYRGTDPWTRAVIMLGAGLLMLGGALTLATSQRQPDDTRAARSGEPGWRAGGMRVGEARLVGAALPLIVLAAVPSALARPQFVWIHGLVTFTLLALFVFSERITRRRAVGASAFVGLAAVAAILVGPTLELDRPWVSVTTLTSRLGGTTAVRFDWLQNYSRLDWPLSASTAFTVRAQFPYYWKAENLDEFDGRTWEQAPLGLASATTTIAQSNLRRWTQKLTVTLGAISTREVIAAGTADAPSVDQQLAGGVSPGTYVAAQPLTPGERYKVTVYTPAPTPAELAAAGDDYPLGALAPDLTIELPATGAVAAADVRFAAYGSRSALVRFDGRSAELQAALLARSPYSRVFALARLLKAGAATPYQYAAAIGRYLDDGYTYDQSPPPSRYPLLAFLFGNRLGYCQQFAGAMALLLRMGGVPARVAVGFTTGAGGASPHTYVVSDLDAHAWVEAWFPSYGWVKLEATPDADPALGGRVPGGTAAAGPPGAPFGESASFGDHRTGGAAPAGRHPRSHRSSLLSAALAIAVIVALLLAALATLLALGGRSRRRARDDRFAELERALARWAGPLPEGLTLTALERRFADSPPAAEYLRRVGRARFARGGPAPTAAQRRALRRRLARELGRGGRIRAWLALPPAFGHRG